MSTLDQRILAETDRRVRELGKLLPRRGEEREKMIAYIEKVVREELAS